MSQTVAKHNCSKCVNKRGIVTCNGCQQSFCAQHLSEHRRHLSQQLDVIQRDYEIFREQMNQSNDTNSIRSRIDAWEKESIATIRTMADKARSDLQVLIEKNRKDLQRSATNLTNELTTNGKSDNFNEVDISKWTIELNKLRTSLTQPLSIRLANDNQISSTVRPIKVTSAPQYKQTVLTQQPKTITLETFHDTAGRTVRADDGLTVKTLGYSSISGFNNYSNGVHAIHFQIMTKKNDGLFFGIFTAWEKLNERASELKSAHGWRDFNRAIISGRAKTAFDKGKLLQTGDELTMTLDCDMTQIRLEHHRTKRTLQQTVNVQTCPFPWKLLLVSFGEDYIRIVR